MKTNKRCHLPLFLIKYQQFNKKNKIYFLKVLYLSIMKAIFVAQFIIEK